MNKPASTTMRPARQLGAGIFPTHADAHAACDRFDLSVGDCVGYTVVPASDGNEAMNAG